MYVSVTRIYYILFNETTYTKFSALIKYIYDVQIVLLFINMAMQARNLSP